MEHFPIFLDLRDRRPIVVGGGEAAARKIDLLIRAGARPLVVAPSIIEEIAAWVAEGRCDHDSGPFRPKLLAGAPLAIAASGEDALDRRVSAAARARGLPVNVVDRAEHSTFIMPAIVDRSPIVVAISTGGTSPTLAQMIRAEIERLLPRSLGRLAQLAGALRPAVGARLPDQRDRRSFWRNVLSGSVAEHALAGRESAARDALMGALAHAGAPAPDAD